MSESPVNIVKLAVGVQSVEELALIQRRFLNQAGNLANNGFYHSTKLMPKKHEAIVKSGSLYWVINRRVLVRQKILNIKQIVGDDNKLFAGISLENKIIKVRPTPMKPFQGWRYYENEDVPPDITDDGFNDEFNNELNKLGLY